MQIYWISTIYFFISLEVLLVNFSIMLVLKSHFLICQWSHVYFRSSWYVNLLSRLALCKRLSTEQQSCNSIRRPIQTSFSNAIFSMNIAPWKLIRHFFTLLKVVWFWCNIFRKNYLTLWNVSSFHWHDKKSFLQNYLRKNDMPFQICMTDLAD